MAFFNMMEIIDLLIMTAALGFIFKDFFSRAAPRKLEEDDPVAYWKGAKRFTGEGFRTAIIVAAPAVILHEMGHKILAMSMGFSAEFHAAYFWLGIAVLLKLMNFGFIFFVPAYVSILGNMTPLQGSLIAFAGPAVNLVIWLGFVGLLRNKTLMKKYRKHTGIIALTAKINMFLFIFNMLPIPGFDGWKVYSGLLGFW